MSSDTEEKILEEFIKECIDGDKYDVIAYAFTQECEDTLAFIIENYLLKIFEAIKSLKGKEIYRENVRTGILSIRDGSWQYYYNHLICLGFVGEYTSNKNTFSSIKEFIQLEFPESNKYISRNMINQINNNPEFGQNKFYRRNDIFERFNLHNNDKEMKEYHKLRQH